jgi:hypothetical protein
MVLRLVLHVLVFALRTVSLSPEIDSGDSGESEEGYELYPGDSSHCLALREGILDEDSGPSRSIGSGAGAAFSVIIPPAGDFLSLVEGIATVVVAGFVGSGGVDYHKDDAEDSSEEEADDCDGFFTHGLVPLVFVGFVESVVVL